MESSGGIYRYRCGDHRTYGEPRVMGSGDVPPAIATSDIVATVADYAGNAVQGEHVPFALRMLLMTEHIM